MNPVYRFTLTAGPDTRQASPVFGDSLALEYALEQNEQFYRGKLSGRLIFVDQDYLFVKTKPFDTKFNVDIQISYDDGQTWDQYWRGKFWKTDCTFDEDTRSVSVTPSVDDLYGEVIAGLEREYNLIDLAPAIQPVKLDKRPLIQVYVPGNKVIACFLSGMYWEQDCEVVDNQDALRNTYKFSKNKEYRVVETSGSVNPVLPEAFSGNPYSGNGTTEYVSGGYKFVRSYGGSSTGSREVFRIVRTAGNVTLWQAEFVNQGEKAYPCEIWLHPVSGSGASGTLTLFIHDVAVFARYITDVESADGTQTYPIPDEDIVPDNGNYSRCVGYYAPSTIMFFDRLTTTPTKWGIYQPGQYFVNPADIAQLGVSEAFPIARSTWGRFSLWFVFSETDWYHEQLWRKQYTLKDAFPLWSVISVLLAKVAPGITHEASAAYSEFLYSLNPITSIHQQLLIVPKSNLVVSNYDEPARKAPITLRAILDMLRDCFRCYWFIDAQGRFRIEHVSWFMKGGIYRGPAQIGVNLTELKTVRNNKTWAFARNEYQFDKPDTAGRYEFGWMDDVTEYFDGFPIEVLSGYVNKDNTEHIAVSQFTSDVDYMLLNPEEISKDGFALLGAAPLVLSASAQATSGTVFQCWVEVGDRFKSGDRVTVSMTGGSAFTGGIAIVTDGISIIGYVTDTEPLSFIATGGVPVYGITCAASDVIASRLVRMTVRNEDELTLPYANIRRNDADHQLQNGRVSFAYLQQYYMLDMPAPSIAIDGVPQTVLGVKRLRTQNIRFPAQVDPDLMRLVKTDIGAGAIQKIIINLSSRSATATLQHDNE